MTGPAGVNLAYEAVGRHAAGSRADHRAGRWIARDGTRTDLTYAELAARSNRFANALRHLGVERGAVVATLLGPTPERHVTALGTLAARGVLCPLFAAFGPDPIRTRLSAAGAQVVVTTPSLHRRKLAPIRADLPALRQVLLAGAGADEGGPGVGSFEALLDGVSDRFAIGRTRADDAALLHFTSGTTGAPKGAVHGHGLGAALAASARAALDLGPDDVCWCTADPGWVTGTSYGLLAPLLVGATGLHVDGELDAARWYGIVADERVTVWYTSPTALRLLRRAGTEVARAADLRSLRLIASVGEPLDEALVAWTQEALGLAVHDTWWQTETGVIAMANPPGEPVRPGAMGRPLPDVEAALLRRGADGRAAVRGGAVEPVTGAGEGELALRAGGPAMFHGYLHDEARTAAAFAGGWYLTGDVARRDADGWYWFSGRADDLIKTAGHLVGPVEVERALLRHAAVAEVGVIGVPDPVAGEVVEAVVVVRPGVVADDALRLELLGFGRARLGAVVAPRAITFAAELPRTASGKVLRRVLRAGRLGGPAGDVSTLAASS